MALDFVILNEKGSPKKTISIGIELHEALVSFAKSKNLYNLVRLSDYYEDSKYALKDFRGLLQDLDRLEALTDSQELLEFSGALTDLVQNAWQAGKEIFILAD